MKLHRRAEPVIKDLFDKSPISIDAFAGGAGAATGSKAAGFPVDIAINHDATAIAVFQDNNPQTECYRADVFSVDPVAACRGRPVRHMHASPDCRDHSRAKGSAPKSESVRALADVVPKWAKAVRPELITLENVPEFVEWGPLDSKGKRIEARKGESFEAWKGQLVTLGYIVEHRVLHAHHYGAPTSRKRLFLIARCDGKPIVWPPATHGPGLKAYRTAAECIDWSIPAPSIFDRKRPLAAATLRRIAAGLVKFVLRNPRPFIVTIDNGSSKGTPQDINKPLSTVIASNQRHAVVAPTIVQTSYGERKGQAPRVLDLHKPLGTIVAGGQKHALVEALLAPFISQFYGGQVGHVATKPLPTITAIDHHALATVKLAPEQIAAQFPNSTLIAPFLGAYYGEGSGKVGHTIDIPPPTITTKDRFALVTVEVDGATYAIVDIGLRMLEPHELLKAQFGKYAKGYRLDKALTKKAQMRLIGNSVVPMMMEAVVRSNMSRQAPRATPARRAA